MTELIHLTKLDQGYYVEYENGLHIGEFIVDVDGYYYYWPIQRAGSWSAQVMRAIADKLDELNKPWDNKIMNDPVFNKGVTND